MMTSKEKAYQMRLDALNAIREQYHAADVDGQRKLQADLDLAKETMLTAWTEANAEWRDSLPATPTHIQRLGPRTISVGYASPLGGGWSRWYSPNDLEWETLSKIMDAREAIRQDSPAQSAPA